MAISRMAGGAKDPWRRIESCLNPGHREHHKVFEDRTHNSHGESIVVSQSPPSIVRYIEGGFTVDSSAPQGSERTPEGAESPQPKGVSTTLLTPTPTPL